MRICSLLPSATEIAFALGLGDSVVGVSHECDFPPEARRIPRVVTSKVNPHGSTSKEIDNQVVETVGSNQSIYDIDLSLFQQANPDIILTQGLCDVCALDYDRVVAAAKTLARPPRIVSLNPTTLSDVLEDIAQVGRDTGRVKEAKRFVALLSERIEKIAEGTRSSDVRPKVACIEWLDPIYTAGHWVPQMVSIAGGEDGLAEAGQPSRKVSWDAVLEYGPDFLILMPCGFTIERTLEESDMLRLLHGWADLPAVRHHRVFAVNGHAYFNRSGPRLVDGLEVLAQIIHPELFPWSAVPDAAQRL
ncbi:MAG: ABC transporter substrate-binding protein [Deltaproteobacteria bacterium]|nr:ABC transporter substrate-binding protein [Deltaproteobacteria bacterium]